MRRNEIFLRVKEQVSSGWGQDTYQKAHCGEHWGDFLFESTWRLKSGRVGARGGIVWFLSGQLLLAFLIQPPLPFDRKKWSFKGWQPATSTTTSCPPEDQQTGERGVHSQQEKEPEGGRGEFEPTRGNQSLVLWQPQETHETCQDHSCLQGPLTVTKVTFFIILPLMSILIVQDCHPRECQHEKLHKHHKKRLLLRQEDLKKILSNQ